MKITMEERCRGEYLPPWYYGYSYYQYVEFTKEEYFEIINKIKENKDK